MYRRGYSGKFGIDVPSETAILFSILGICLLIYSFFPNVKKAAEKAERAKNKSLFNTDKVVCKKCNRQYKSKHIQIPVCPKCDGELIEFQEKGDNDKSVG